MKTISSFGLVLVLAFGGLALAHPSSGMQTLTGEVSSDNCGVRYTVGMTPRRFTRECVAAGSAYVLKVGERSYWFSNQADPRLHVHAGERVVVVGTVTGSEIAASRIDAAAPQE